MNDETITLHVPTPDGEFIARYSTKGLASLDFPSKRTGETACANAGASPQVLAWHRAATAAIRQTLAGRAAEILPPLDFSGGTEFQRAVWAAMRQIPTGQTLSYGEIARRIGRPKSVRAVGGACGANPIPVLVPCHRVLAANRKLGGFPGDWSGSDCCLNAKGCAFSEPAFGRSCRVRKSSAVHQPIRTGP